MLIVDKHCSDVCCDKLPVPQTDRKNKQVKEHSDSEILICNHYGEKLAVFLRHLKYQNLLITNKVYRRDKNAICLIFPYLLNICRKFDFLIFQGSLATFLTWGGQCRMRFVANFIGFSAALKFWKSVKIWQSYGVFKGGNFFETQCSYSKVNFNVPLDTYKLRSFRKQSDQPLALEPVFPTNHLAGILVNQI